MKFFIIVFSVILLSTSLLAQPDVPYPQEILTQTINANQGYEYHRFKIEPVPGKTTWCWSTVNEKFVIVTGASSSTQEIYGDNCTDDEMGFYECANCSVYELPFWVTLNKITVYCKGDFWEEVLYFYIDYRDCRFADGPGGGVDDISLLVDHSDGKVYYDSNLEYSCDTNNYTEITNGQTLTIWELTLGKVHMISPVFAQHLLLYR